MHQRVPLEAFLEIQPLLAQNQQAAEEIEIGVADILVRECLNGHDRLTL